MRDRVFVIGGGESLREFDFSQLKDLDTITVNRSILCVPEATYFITIDYSFLRKCPESKNELSKTSACKFFVVAETREYIKEIDGRVVDVRFGLVYDLNLFDVVIKSKKVSGIGYSWCDFGHGNNSGYCALQLAVLLGYKEIYLLGIDLVVKDNTHFHKGYGESKDKMQKKLDEYFGYFKQGLMSLRGDIKVYSCSPISRLNEIIPYKSIEEVL